MVEGPAQDNPERIDYVINNSKLSFPVRPVELNGHAINVQKLARDGYVRLTGLFTESQLEGMRVEVARIAKEEKSYRDPNNPDTDSDSQYLRWLLDKSEAFECLFDAVEPRQIARALLGPQIRFENVDARIVPPNTAGQVVPWHIHLRTIPSPYPEFFCYPHAIHGLLYLNDVTEKEGQLCVLPGSHLKPDLRIADGDTEPRENQEVLSFQAGDCVLMHGNLWHKTLPASLDAGNRALIIFGFVPSWLRTEQSGGVKGHRDFFAERLAKTDDPEERELLGEFAWC